MPSPFPGMDPYLEDPRFWGGVHAKLIAAANDALNQTLPAGYFADIGEHVWLRVADRDDRRLLGKPDVFVAGANGPSAGGRAAGGIVTAAPTARVTLPKGRKRRQQYLKVVAPDHTTVVTVVEFLSPANKDPGPDREKYLAKREEYFAAGTSLVEIDLLRDGGRMPFGSPSPAPADYFVFVARGGRYPEAEVWGFTARDPAPTVPVPLRPKDGDAALPLQLLLTAVYDTNRYADRIDYSVPPVPPFGPADAAWAADLLKKLAKKRKK